MVYSMIPLLCWTLCISSVSAEDQNITAGPGDTVTLPCRTSNQKPIIAVVWSRKDLRKEYVLSFKDDQIDPFNQHPSYKNRVDLQDRQMKDGDASLVLKNVTTNDNGTYECRVQNEGNLERKLISTINLDFLPPGKKDGGSKDGSGGVTVGLIVGLIVCLVVAGILFLMYKKQSACFKKKNPDPAAAL